MRKLSHDEIAQKRLKTNESLNAPRIPLIVLAENIRSLYNIGSIFRTSDGARVEQLILSGYSPTPPRKEIEKTALGSTKSVPWQYAKDPLEALRQIKARGVTICCLEQTDRSIPYYSIERAAFPLCLIIGNEITGISKPVLAESDFAIEIPMHGIKHSLNVAVAYGIAIFELARIWRNGNLHRSNARV